ncbi:MAG: cysteine synthase [Clostridiaceae bacterium BRH_c20a]|nr:MAG: cysteine synthase [Clostridiaceae bacterium BRH_c20a]
MIYNNITELIGNTPIIKLNTITNKDMAQVYVKLEIMNPSRSVKDRAAFNMIKDAEERNILKPGATIIEPTSGTTGIGLAMVAAAKGYKSIIVMPDSASKERIALLKAYGAEVILTPAADMIPGSLAKVKELLEQTPDSYMPQQFINMANPEIHKITTAEEIIKDFKDRLDVFVATAGTGGTISGTGEVLRKEYPDLQIYVVESKNSPVIAGGKPGPHKIVGTGPGFIPDTLNINIFDEIVHIDDDDAINTSKLLAQKEGILCGISAGAAVYVALQKAKNLNKDQKVLAIIPDTGERYLSTGLLT